METFIFAANAVLPIIVLIALGYGLKQIVFLDDLFLKKANALVFNVALPALLFYNVYSIESLRSLNWRVIGFVIVIISILFLLGMLTVRYCTDDPRKKGVLLQCIFRSNFAIIGIPLAEILGGTEAVAMAAVISAFSIPLYNILAVIALSIYIDGHKGQKTSGKQIVKGICKNPLIIGVAVGMLCLIIRHFIPYDEVTKTYAFSLKTNLSFLHTAIKNVSSIASPLALIVLGGQFRFQAVRSLAKDIAIGTVWRLVLAPTIALSSAILLSKYTSILHLTKADYPALIALFGTPVAVSSAIMAGAMGSDEALAGQLVVWTSLLSMVSLFIIIIIFKGMGLLV